MRALAEALAAYEPGTAGASLKAAVAACAVLDLAEERGAPADEDALAQEAAQALEALGEEAAQRAAEGWPDVRAVCGQLLEEGGVQAASGLLADAGGPTARRVHPRALRAGAARAGRGAGRITRAKKRGEASFVSEGGPAALCFFIPRPAQARRRRTAPASACGSGV